MPGFRAPCAGNGPALVVPNLNNKHGARRDSECGRGIGHVSMRAFETAVTDLSVWQYYETAANLGDTGELKPIEAYLTGLPYYVLQREEADPSPSNRCHE